MCLCSGAHVALVVYAILNSGVVIQRNMYNHIFLHYGAVFDVDSMRSLILNVQNMPVM